MNGAVGVRLPRRQAERVRCQPRGAPITDSPLNELHGRDDPDRPAIAYLVPWYPAISLTFVLREVEALRRLGRRVITISIHRARPEDLAADADRQAYSTTYVLSPPRIRDHLAAHRLAMRTRPGAYVSTLLAALRAGPTEPAAKARDMLHFCEAVVAWWHNNRSGVRHIHGVFAGPAADAAMLAARLGGEGWSWSLATHGTDMLQVPRADLAAKLRSARFVTVASDFGRSQLMALVDQEQWPKIKVVHCGLDLSEYNEAGATESSPGRYDTDTALRLITVGRLEREKGHSLLLDAIASPGCTRVDLTMIGDGDEMPALRAQAERLAIADRVRFLGRVGQDEIREHYARADAFCLSSLGEGIPVALMEAMALRLPVIAPRIMGIPELVEDGVSGLLVTPGRPDALAEAIAALAAQRRRWPEMGKAGRARVCAQFEIMTCVRELDATITRWLGTAPVPSAAGDVPDPG
jgi:colanic acid/amylovoran biosynthesis glycosyltransferase